MFFLKNVFLKKACFFKRYFSENCSAVQFFRKNGQNLLNENNCESSVIIRILFQPLRKCLYIYDLSSEQPSFGIALSGWL